MRLTSNSETRMGMKTTDQRMQALLRDGHLRMTSPDYNKMMVNTTETSTLRSHRRAQCMPLLLQSLPAQRSLEHRSTLSRVLPLSDPSSSSCEGSERLSGSWSEMSMIPFSSHDERLRRARPSPTCADTVIACQRLTPCGMLMSRGV